MIDEQLYRDPVHNLIVLDRASADDAVLLRLIDTPEMQRLRRVRQLGLASYTYQGAEHSRFTHSVGVMWIATRILDRLTRIRKVPATLHLATRCAALLHDTGHGPLSHVFEAFMGIHHEEWTRRIILDRASGVNRVLRAASPALPRKVVDVMEGRSDPPFLSQIISSQLDADRFDYLLRDSLMTGVKYGVYDLERILHMLRLDPHGRRIVVAGNGIMPVEKYLQSRYSMYLQVYLHKTVRAAETMLGKLLLRASDLARRDTLPALDETEPVARLLRAGAATGMTDYLLCDDDSVFSCMKRWRDCGDATLADLSRRILERSLFKTLDISRTRNLARRLREARAAVRGAGLDPRYYFAVDESGNVPYLPYDPRTPEVSKHIQVEDVDRPGRYRDLHEVSEVVRGLTRAAFTIRRAVFPEHANGVDLRAEMERIFLA